MTEPTLLPAEPLIDAVQLTAAQDQGIIAPMHAALFDVRGPGAVECIQGILTNDVAKPGPDAAIYGALLTPKGMIATDLWALRTEERFVLVVPAAGGTVTGEILRRTLPPRLARTTDQSESDRTLILLGASAEAMLQGAGVKEIPPAGRIVRHDGCLVARPLPGAPFRFLIVGPIADVESLERQLHRAGAQPATEAQVIASRILAGWPALGSEIDEKTLPQEARFDEIGGVSYTKGCYTGQETVARIHFRGHPNRELRGLVWESAEPLADRSIQHLGREVGTVRSTLVGGGRRIGLAPIRREVPNDEIVSAGGAPARVVSLPMPASFLIP